MGRLKGFDGMRAIACLAVLFHHLYQRLGLSTAMRPGTDYAEAGVSLFFVLSGALLSLPFWHNYLNGLAMPNLKHYAIHRAARILPAFYLVLIISAIASALLSYAEAPWLRLALGLLLVAPYYYVSFFPAELNGPLWSIGLEVSCYLLLPLFLFVAWKLGQRHWLKALVVVVCAIGLLQLLNPFIIDWFMTDSSYKGWQWGLVGGAKQWLPYWNVVSFMGQFLCGSLAALAIAVSQDRVSVKLSWLFDGLFIIFLILAVMSIAKNHYPGTPNSFTGQPYAAPLFSLACAGCLFALANSAVIYRVLDNWLFRKIATLSFGIYLWHMLIMELIRTLWLEQYVYNGMYVYWQWLALSVMVTFISVAIAALSFYKMEQPILQWARNKTASSPEESNSLLTKTHSEKPA